MSVSWVAAIAQAFPAQAFDLAPVALAEGEFALSVVQQAAAVGLLRAALPSPAAAW
jgi:hypothetical protein